MIKNAICFLRIIGNHLPLFKGILVKLALWIKGDTIKNDVQSKVKIFVSESKRMDKRYLRRLRTDIYFSYYFCQTKPEEYFLFGFNKKNPKERKKYITDIQKDMLCIKYSNVDDFYQYLKDKYGTYKLFGEFFQRNMIEIKEKESYPLFCDFISKHDDFVLKKNYIGRGEGISHIYKKDICDLKQWFDDIINRYDSCVIEEVINQSEELSKWHPHSVNTVRISGINTKSGVVIFAPIIRVGRGGSFVDNASQGGLFANIDKKTGIIYTDGFDELGHMFTEHPDTHIKFKGTLLPEWNSLVEIVTKLNEILPSNPYISWDMAHTNTGWVVVEGNWGQLLMTQIAENKGLKKEFVALMKQSLYEKHSNPNQ